jgi:hypothetical protein
MIEGNAGTTLLDAVRLAAWPTAKVNDAERGGCLEHMDGRRSNLNDSVHLASWPTSRATDGSNGSTTLRSENGIDLPATAGLTGWATPSATDGKIASNPGQRRGQTLENYRAMKRNMKSGARIAITHPSLQAQLVVSGRALTGSSVATGSGGQLNPDHSRWLMGFPVEWASCGATATASSRRSRRHSSGQRARRSRKRDADR